MKLLSSALGPLIVPTLVVCEAGYLIGKHLGAHAEAAFLRSLTSPDVRVEPVLTADLARMAELVEHYADLRLGTTDAAVIATTERLDLTTVATLDRRHFSVVRPRHIDRLQTLP